MADRKKPKPLRVWVIALKDGHGKWAASYGSWPTRSGAIALYNFRHGPGAYTENKAKGYVLAMKATLYLEQPKSKRRKP